MQQLYTYCWAGLDVTGVYPGLRSKRNVRASSGSLQISFTKKQSSALDALKQELEASAAAGQATKLEEQKNMLKDLQAAEKSAYIAESKANTDVALANARAESQVRKM